MSGRDDEAGSEEDGTRHTAVEQHPHHMTAIVLPRLTIPPFGTPRDQCSWQDAHSNFSYLVLEYAAALRDVSTESGECSSMWTERVERDVAPSLSRSLARSPPPPATLSLCVHLSLSACPPVQWFVPVTAPGPNPQPLLPTVKQGLSLPWSP